METSKSGILLLLLRVSSKLLFLITHVFIERNIGLLSMSSNFKIAIRVLLRLALLRDSGYKMLLHGGETPNTEEDLSASSSRQKLGGFVEPGGPHGPIHAHQRQSQWSLEGRALSALNRFGENARIVADPMWLQKTLSPCTTAPGDYLSPLWVNQSLKQK